MKDETHLTPASVQECKKIMVPALAHIAAIHIADCCARIHDVGNELIVLCDDEIKSEPKPLVLHVPKLLTSIQTVSRSGKESRRDRRKREREEKKLRFNLKSV